MRRFFLPVVVVAAGVLGLALVFQPSAQAGTNGGGATTTKVTYPTTTTRPHQTTTTKVTYPTTTTTKPPMTTTTRPHETTTTKPPMTTTTQPATTTTMAGTTTTQATTTTTQPPETTTTEQPNLTILTLAAQVNGGTATLADFDLFANGPVSLSGITDSPGVTFAVVPPGFYGLSDTQSPLAVSEAYSSSGWDCVGTAETTPSSATLDAGEDALCVITFTSQFAATTTTVPGASTVPGATTTPGATTVPGATTLVLGTTVPGATTTPGGEVVQSQTPSGEVAVPVTPSNASASLPFTGDDARLGLGSGLLLVMVGGLALLLVRRLR